MTNLNENSIDFNFNLKIVEALIFASTEPVSFNELKKTISDIDILEAILESLEKKYSDSPQNRRDEAIRSCGFAGQTIMLAARQMGLDSCPMVGFDYDEMAKIIELPDDHLIVLMIVVGKSLEPAKQRGGQLSLDEVVFKNKFN